MSVKEVTCPCYGLQLAGSHRQKKDKSGRQVGNEWIVEGMLLRFLVSKEHAFLL